MQQQFDTERSECRAKEIEDKIAAVMALARETADHVEPGTTSDTAWLYDEKGFPK